MRHSGMLVSLVAVTVITPLARSQQDTAAPRSFEYVFGILHAKFVQDELKLSADQIKQLKEGAEKSDQRRREAMPKLKEARVAKERTPIQRELMKQDEAAAAELLRPEQRKRFQQIRWQREGVTAFNDPEVRKELKLTEEQHAETVRLSRELFRQRAGPNADDKAKAQFAELWQQQFDQAVHLLTVEQKAKWKELLGAPLKAEFSNPYRP